MRALLVLLLATSAHAELEVGGYFGNSTSTIAETHLTLGSDSGFAKPPPNRHGVVVGWSLRTPLHPALLFEADFLYVQKGSDDQIPVIHVDYLEAPLLLRFDPLRTSRSPIKVFVGVGIAPALRVRCSSSNVSPVGPYAKDCGDLDDVMPRPPVPNIFDVGRVLVGGVAVSLPHSVLSIEARDVHGLVDTLRTDGRTSNRSTYVLVGVSAVLR